MGINKKVKKVINKEEEYFICEACDTELIDKAVEIN